MTDKLKQEVLDLLEQIEHDAQNVGYQAAVDAYEAKIAQMQADHKAELANLQAMIDELTAAHQNEPDAPEPPTPEVVIPEFTLENSGIEGFMNDQTYYEPGFATGTGLTVVDEYIKGAKEGSKQSWTEKPAKIPLEFDSIEGVQAINGIYNLIPGREYTYYRNEGENVVRGKFRTKPNTVRMIEMADECPVVNIRDLGGYKCEGGHVGYNRIIRSATLKELKAGCANAKILQQIGVTDEITFSSSNPARTDLGLWKGVYYGIDAYTTVITKSTQWSKIKSIFTRILNDVKDGGCALIHCFAGTDRSGTVAALLLGVLGVCEGDIIKDWEMTSFSCWFNRVRISDWETRDVVKKECPEGQLRQFFQKMKSTYGENGESYQKQCEAFLKKCGVTATQIANFKKYMIV